MARAREAPVRALTRRDEGERVGLAVMSLGSASRDHLTSRLLKLMMCREAQHSLNKLYHCLRPVQPLPGDASTP